MPEKQRIRYSHGPYETKANNRLFLDGDRAGIRAADVQWRAGVLAEDTIPAAADLNVPLVAMTLLHRKGYLHQRLDASWLAKRGTGGMGG
jgi:hypothetical protein